MKKNRKEIPMKNILSLPIDKIKHGLYLFSILCLLLVSAVAFYHALFDNTNMPFLSDALGDTRLSLTVICGAILLGTFFLLLYRKLSKLSEKALYLITISTALVCMAVQFFLLFHLQPILRYDHLKVFDQALHIFRTGEISLTAASGYFGQYPFNIPITLFHFFVLNFFKFLGIPEASFMIALQCAYVLFIDLGLCFAYRIIHMLHSHQAAALFAFLCFFNPVFYFCGAGCYTTTLMLPLLTGNLLLLMHALKEPKKGKKIFYFFCLGIFMVISCKLRLTMIITLIAFVGYLILHRQNPFTHEVLPKSLCILFLSFTIGAVICYGGSMALEHTYVKGDYSDTQLPPSYYFMFAANPDTRGTFNEQDHEMILQYPTLEQKNEISWKILKERLYAYGPLGILSLADHKIDLTWSDGTEDYSDFWTTVRNYGRLHSFTAGNRSDICALYFHIYHVCMLGMLLIFTVGLLKKRCDTPFYMIPLNLLGAFMFHILWESYCIYSFSFLPLILMLSGEGICLIAKNQKHAFSRISKLPAILCGGLLILIFITNYQTVFQTEFARIEPAVVQDMSGDENMEALLTGECITQTFRTDRPFSHVGVKALNPLGEVNASCYKIELLDSEGNMIDQKTFRGSEVISKDYCYMKLGPIVPPAETEYTIRITAESADETNNLTFLYYHTQNYDIYEDGQMKGLNSDEKTDLTFRVFLSTSGTFF